MSGNDQMPKIDFSKLRQTDIDFIKLVERQNLERVRKLQVLRRRNVLTGSILAAGILGIYGYSIYAVRQESFLDDFDEPATTTN